MHGRSPLVRWVTWALALVVALTLWSLRPERPGTPTTRTFASGPPFPDTRDPQQILANLGFFIEAGGFGKRRATVAQMAERPHIRRLMEVENHIDDDYWLLELENPSGQYIGIAAVRKGGDVMAFGGGDGVTEPSPANRVADLRKVEDALAARFGASRARYVVGLSSIDIPHEYYPMIAADSPQGTMLVTRRLEVYRETQRVPKAQRTDTTRQRYAIPDVGKPAFVYKSGDLLILESVGTLSREAVQPERRQQP